MREPLLGVAIGKKGVGKTFTTNKVLAKYVQGDVASGAKPRKVLILDVNDEFTHIKSIALKDVIRFSSHPIIEARRIRPFMPNGRKMTLNDLAATLDHILNFYTGGLLLIEDINKFVSDSLPQDIMGAIATNRHRDLDIILHYQGIGRILPKVWQNMNFLRFHKITESVERHKSKYEDKVELLKIAEAMVNSKYFAGNERYFQYVDIENMCLMGKVDEKEFEAACRKYIEENYRRLVTPMLSVRFGNNERKFTADTAVKKLIADYKSMYYPKK